MGLLVSLINSGNPISDSNEFIPRDESQSKSELSLL